MCLLLTLKSDVTARRLEVITETGRRRWFSKDDKARIVEETLVPGAPTISSTSLLLAEPFRSKALAMLCSGARDQACIGQVARWLLVTRDGRGDEDRPSIGDCSAGADQAPHPRIGARFGSTTE